MANYRAKAFDGTLPEFEVEIADTDTLNVGNIEPLSGILTLGGSTANPDVYIKNGHDLQVWGSGAELRVDGGADLKVQGGGVFEVPATGAHRIYGGTFDVDVQTTFQAPNTTNPKAIVQAAGGEPADTILFQVQDSGGGNLLSLDTEGDLVIAGSFAGAVVADGTDSQVWVVNEDAVAGTPEDSGIVWLSADGTNIDSWRVKNAQATGEFQFQYKVNPTDPKDLSEVYTNFLILDQPNNKVETPLDVELTGGNLLLPTTTASAGQLQVNSAPFLHAFNNNIFLGPNAGNFTTTGSSLIGIGSNTFSSATGPISRSVAVGDNALASTTASGFNVAVGYYGLNSLTTGDYNTAIGTGAGQGSTTADSTVAVGAQAMGNGVNVADGIVAVGAWSLNANTSGVENVAVGFEASRQNTTGFRNVSVGYEALRSGTTVHDNIAIGYRSLYQAGNNRDNIAIGSEVMQNATTGTGNVGIGKNALNAITTTSTNVAVGYEAGFSTTGAGNVFLGDSAGRNELGSNKLYIANSSTTNPLIGGDFTAGTVTFNGAYTFPAADGNAGQQLQTDGLGNVTWANPGGGGVYIYPPGATNPTVPAPNDGDIYFNTVFESWQYYDATRSKWLSITEFPFSWGHDYTDGSLLRGSGINNAGVGSGILIPRDATIKRITARSRAGNVTKTFNVLVNGATASSFSLAARIYKNNGANVDVSEDDYVWVESTAAGAASLDVAVIFWVSWRT